MQAIILASGVGKRLLPHTQDKPKCLIPIQGIPLIEIIIDQLLLNGVQDVYVTTGHLSEILQSHLTERYQEKLRITFVHSPLYAVTNYIYSLHLTAPHLKEDETLLIHSDLFLEPIIITKILTHSGSGVLIRTGSEDYAVKDFRAVISEGRVKTITVSPSQKTPHSALPLYKLTHRDLILWLKKIEEFILAGKVNLYAEDALNQITEDLHLVPLYLKDEICMEIDTPEDLDLLEELLKKRQQV